MPLSPAYIRSLPGDQECIAALAWLAEQAERYPTGRFVPPLQPRKRDTEIRPYLAMTMRLGRRRLSSMRGRISRLEWCIDGAVESADGNDEELVAALVTRVLTRVHAGRLLVTSGQDRHVLDVWLDELGPLLVKAGYTLQPCLSGGSVSFITIRKARKRWDLVYFETCTGKPVADGILLAQSAGKLVLQSQPRSLQLWHAAGAYARWMLDTFGVACQLTAGMAAVCAARVSLPNDFLKWRTPPLLVAMCREGGGYRGGITYAIRYRGPTWRIDVNRQYTAALEARLPLRSAFGYIPYRAASDPWLALCRVRLTRPIPYPLGVWDGPDYGFSVRTVGPGEYVSILSSGEVPGLLAIGVDVRPEYGYVHTAQFSFAGYVDLLRMVLRAHGRDSPEARFCKPLGNYVYGKLGQRPTRTELMFSEADPGDNWFPYWDDDGKAWENIWERTVTRHTGSQHVEIAATITGLARSQTVSMWASALESGATVVRCHTDSLTVDICPDAFTQLSESQIGEWRMEQAVDDSIIVGPNSYFADGVAHIAGVSEPTYDMVERLADGQTVAITQSMQTPRRGFVRGAADRERTFKASEG